MMMTSGLSVTHLALELHRSYVKTLTPGSVTLTCFLLLTIAGMDWVTRVQKFLLVILLFAQADMLIGGLVTLSILSILQKS